MSKSRAGVPPARAAARGSWFALVAITLFAQPALSEENSADEFVAAAIDKRQYLAAVTLIARHGKVVSWKAHGRRELGSPDALDPNAIFRIYSMTKPITSVAALMLMEHGKFQLDEPVSKYLPELGELRVLAGGTADAPELRAPKRPMTIRQLFVHAAGLAGGENTPTEALRLIERAELHRARDLQNYVRMLSKVPLAADPGALFNYDGVHTNVLARLVEVWSGQTFDRYLQEKIFAPLRMKDTGFTVPVGQRHRIAQMTATDAAGRLIPSATYAGIEPGRAINLYSSGAGGLYSTPADYLRFAQMLLDGGELEGVRILSHETVSLMMTNQLGTLDPPQREFRPGEGFGLGGAVGIDQARRARLGSVGDFGWFGAASTYFTVDPREGLIAMLFMQHLPEGSGAAPPRLNGQFYTLVYQSLVQ
ncbi:serine hydrolase domain-containing protein [Peristeroidobacter agariperforans]|uniref:serine hydrolase domain-containing protein n=1 Tax=Peristeroidobacter agariperforans TaxID=268404 RepID=UPI00101C1852|nr:serine hydrolase domain-containing protein [Peristeroidobacter agariperforans]